MNNETIKIIVETVKKGVTGNGTETGIKIQAVIALVGGFLSSFLGGDDTLLHIMIIMVILDYILGMAKAIMLKKVDSKVGGLGFAKKIIEFIIVAASFNIEKLLGGVIPLRDIAIIFYVCNEGLSIIENAGACGVPIPEKLKSALVQLKDKPELITDKEGQKDETDI